jgi:putative flavoprotein involved in K+ transport
MNMRSGRPGPVDVVVVGAGQAGLAVSYYLRAFGVEHVVLERGRVGESWRSARWDSFTLVTPNWMTRLPGYVLGAGTGSDFFPRDAVVGLLEGFAASLPVNEGVEVVSVTTDGHGYLVTTPAQQFFARAVVIAGGGQRIPVVPPLAARLPAELHQCDAARYRNPAGLPPGAVLVVGSGQSGAQIADELAAAGREVLLATSRVARVPRRYRGRDVHEWSVELGLYDQATDAVTDPAEFREPHPMLSGARRAHRCVAATGPGRGAVAGPAGRRRRHQARVRRGPGREHAVRRPAGGRVPPRGRFLRGRRRDRCGAARHRLGRTASARGPRCPAGPGHAG